MAQRVRTRAAPPARVKPVLELYLWNMVEIKGIFEGRFQRADFGFLAFGRCYIVLVVPSIFFREILVL